MVLYNHLKNKHLTEYIKSNGNDLATMQFSIFCAIILSNNSAAKVSKFFDLTSKTQSFPIHRLHVSSYMVG